MNFTAEERQELRKQVLDKKQFRKWFNDAMKVKEAYGCQVDSETGEIYDYTVRVEPRLVIRDFDVIDLSELTGEDDKEFSSFEDAWEYFELVFPSCRVMNNAGQIYFDYY
jgi:hypothetical protein